MSIECVNFIFVAGPTPGLSACINLSNCVIDPQTCETMCHFLQYPKGVCDGNICCCQLGWNKSHYYKYLYMFEAYISRMGI